MHPGGHHGSAESRPAVRGLSPWRRTITTGLSFVDPSLITPRKIISHVAPFPKSYGRFADGEATTSAVNVSARALAHPLPSAALDSEHRFEQELDRSVRLTNPLVLGELNPDPDVLIGEAAAAFAGRLELLAPVRSQESNQAASMTAAALGWSSPRAT
jgi:hypothetical protein